MNNDRRTFLDGSKSPRKPLTEAKMIKYPADLEHKNHRDMTPAEKQRWISYNRAYNQAVQTRDFSGIETRPSLGTKSKEYQDAWKAWNRQRTMHAANRDFHLIKPFVAPKEKTKKTKGGKKAYFMDYPNKYEEVTTETKPLLVEYQTPEREQMQMKELQRLQTIARAKAKAWHPNTSKSYEQERVFDAAVDKLSAEMRDAENERRTKEVIDKDGKVMKKPSAALLKQLAPQREAQLKRDAEDRAGEWMGTAQFDRDSNKASILIDEIKKGLARAKTTKKESVMTKGYTELLEVALITLCNKYELDLKTLLVELQTPERRDEMEKLYFKAEDKFMRNIGSDALMNALNAIDKKNYTEVGSKSTYGKGGKIVKRAK
jgi:hypothetical protein